jgi:hypothetical protein
MYVRILGGLQRTLYPINLAPFNLSSLIITINSNLDSRDNLRYSLDAVLVRWGYH